jgi:hypothetical protein
MLQATRCFQRIPITLIASFGLGVTDATGCSREAEKRIHRNIREFPVQQFFERFVRNFANPPRLVIPYSARGARPVERWRVPSSS